MHEHNGVNGRMPGSNGYMHGFGPGEEFDVSKDPALVYAKWTDPFLKEFATSGNMRKACEAAEVCRSKVVDRMAKNGSFRDAVARAWADAVDRLEETAWDRAVNKSDRLMTFLLIAYRGEVFSQKHAREAGTSFTLAQAALDLDDNGE